MARPRKYPTDAELAEVIEAELWKIGPMLIDELVDAASARVGIDIPTINVRKAIHRHRNQLSNESGALIVSTVGTAWVYEMTSDPVRITEWLAMRERAVETQLKTMLAQSETSVRISPPSSNARKRARVERKLIGRLVEDIEELRTEVA